MFAVSVRSVATEGTCRHQPSARVNRYRGARLLPRRLRQWLQISLLALSLILPDALLSFARASDGEPLKLGILPRRNATLTTEIFTPLVQYLSRELGREIQLVTAPDFDTFWSNVKAGNFDIVHYNQFHFVRSSEHYRAIAHNEEFGSSTVAGALYTRKDSGIERVEQLRGHKIIFGGGQDAMMSYILPRYLLLQAGLQPGDYEEVFAKSPPNTLIALYYGDADAGGAGDILIDLQVVKDSIDTSQLVHLAVTEQLLHLAWAVKRSMPEEQAQAIQTLLTSLDESPEGQAILKQARMTGIGVADDSSYEPHRRIIEQVMPIEESGP